MVTGERPMVTRRGAIAAGATAAVLSLIAGGAGGYIYGVGHNPLDKLLNGTPDSRDSKVTAKQLVLEADKIPCYSDSIFDVAGSQAFTRYDFLGKKFEGRGARFKQGKLIKQTCVESDGITISDTKIDDKDVKQVDIAISAVRFDSRYDTASTQVENVTPPKAKVLFGVVDVTSNATVVACQAAGDLLGYDIEACNSIAAVAKWDDDNQSKLEDGLRLRTQQTVQEDCGKVGWSQEQLAIADGFALQALSQLYPNQKTYTPDDARQARALIDVRFVDDQGDVTTYLPDFKKSKWDNKDGNELERELPGTPNVTFSDVRCDLVQAYESPFK